MKSVRLALAGTGFIGRIHWMCYRSLSGVYDPAPARVVFDTVYASHPDEAQRFEFQRVVPYADVAATCHDVDMLDICTPNAVHRPLAEAAIAAGIPIYCEKPVDLDGEHALELARRADAAGVFNQAALVYCHTRRDHRGRCDVEDCSASRKLPQS
jgi:predicted dehydrogenase